MVLEQFIIDADIIWDQVGKTFFENPEAKPGRIMRVQVVNAGIVEDLTGYTLNLGWTSVRDPSKFGLDAFDDVDITKGIFEIEYTSGMLTNIGPLNASLQLVPHGEGRPIESNNFKLTVKNSAINAEAIQGENSFSALETALVNVNGWNARIDDVEQDFIQRANDMEAMYPKEIVSLNEKLSHKASQTALNVEKARIDSFTTLAIGSTTGDAELIDGRVGADSIVYPNIGRAIRTQFNNINNNITRLYESGVICITAVWRYGTLSGADGTSADNNARIKTDYIYTSETNQFIVSVIDGYQFNIYYYFDDVGTFSHSTGFGDTTKLLQSNLYVKIVVKKDDESIFTEPLNMDYATITRAGGMLAGLNYGVQKNTAKLDKLSTMSLNMLDSNHPDTIVGYYMELDGSITQSTMGILNISGHIEVTSGKTYYFGGKKRETVRFLTAFNYEQLAVSYAGADFVTEWVCPEGITTIRLSYHNDDDFMMNQGNALLPYEPYGIYVPTSMLRISELADALNTKDATKKPYITKRGNLSDGQTIELEVNNIKTNKEVAFSAIIQSFVGLQIGHGTTQYTAYYMTIDNNDLSVYSYTNSTTPAAVYPHGLTITNNIQVWAKKSNTQELEVKIISNGQVFKKSGIAWMGDNGMIFAKSIGSSLTDCVFSWSSKSYASDIYAFGDSYFGISSTNRWISHLLKDGHTNILLDAYGGKGSEAAYWTAKTALTHGTPKIVFWCMGMNDPDNADGANATWLNRYNSMKAECEAHDIELVLATIPTAKGSSILLQHKYKNAIIRGSGLRYVDFAKAVGSSDVDGTWYDSMLDVDGVHPTDQGAITLYLQALSDLPELMNC